VAVMDMSGSLFLSVRGWALRMTQM
jgi:hypothetical protein